MKTCNADGDCRRQYSCVFPEQINMDGELQVEVPPADRIARIIDLDEELASSKICVAVSSQPGFEETDSSLDTPWPIGLDGGT
jgi:hypothetical protein